MAANATADGDGGARDVARLAAWLRGHRDIVAISGAGISTASGIPDYRDDDGQWKRGDPMTHQAFVTSDAKRRRYWARSFAGWQHVTAAQPNAAHRALAALQQDGPVTGVITQNVDRLHQRAGSHNVVDLHGRLDAVICLACATRYRRQWLQRRLAAMNPDWEGKAVHITPDGDAEIAGANESAFRYPDCPYCGGMLKPDVVFFGGAVPAVRRERAEAQLVDADGVLVVGSSLMVWSSYRLVRSAAQHQRPVVAVNNGRTRADDLLDFKLTGDVGTILSAVREQLRA